MPLGRMIISLSGTKLTQEETEVLHHPMVLGVILFPKNYQDKNTLKALIAAIQTIAQASNKKDIPIFTDHEGGRIQWLKRNFTHLPPLKDYGKLYNHSKEEGLAMALKFSTIMAQELMELGIIPLAPVLDLDQGNTAISTKGRSFHSDTKACISLAKTFIEGMDQYGIPATGKHFPDHSNPLIGDSHEQTLVDPRPIEEISGLTVFRALASKLKAIMTAHILYPQVDPDHMVALSKKWLSILRDNLQFKGVVVSDCLSMKGAAFGTPLAKTLSYLSNVDVIILCHLSSKDYLTLLKDIPKSLIATSLIDDRISNWIHSTALSRKNLRSYLPATAYHYSKKAQSRKSLV